LAAVCCLALPKLPTFADAPTLTIAADAETYQVGQQPKLSISITNRSDKDVYLVGSLDGSTDERRFPKCRLEVLNSEGKPVTLELLGCGNMNKLRLEDFVAVLPSQAFDPFGKGFFAPYQMYQFPVQRPGVYTVRFFPD
jgi:hypothetical protein